MKVIKRNNIRVEVLPQSYGYRELTEKEAISDCQRIKDEIKRHCDTGQINIEWDTEEVCSFCGRTWEVCEKFDPDDEFLVGEPVCCTKASKEFRVNLAKEATHEQ